MQQHKHSFLYNIVDEKVFIAYNEKYVWSYIRWFMQR